MPRLGKTRYEKQVRALFQPLNVEPETVLADYLILFR